MINWPVAVQVSYHEVNLVVNLMDHLVDEHLKLGFFGELGCGLHLCLHYSFKHGCLQQQKKSMAFHPFKQIVQFVLVQDSQHGLRKDVGHMNQIQAFDLNFQGIVFNHGIKKKLIMNLLQVIILLLWRNEFEVAADLIWYFPLESLGFCLLSVMNQISLVIFHFRYFVYIFGFYGS